MIKSMPDRKITSRNVMRLVKNLLSVVFSISVMLFCACIMTTEGQEMSRFLDLHLEIPSVSAMRLDEDNQTVQFLRGKNLSQNLEGNPVFDEFRSNNFHAKIALAFLSTHHSFFKLNSPFRELNTESVATDELGYTHIKFKQVFEAIPIANAEIIVHLNRLNQVYLVNGNYVPTPSNLGTTPSISGNQAMRRVEEKFPDHVPESFDFDDELIIFVLSNKELRLAHRLRIRSDKIIGSEFIVDAATGDVLAEIPTVYNKKR